MSSPESTIISSHERPEETLDFKKRRQVKQERLNYWEKFQCILNMFGTDQARENFLDLCRRYKEAYLKQQSSNIVQKKIEETGRAGLHIEIMEILQKLSLHTKPGSEEEKILLSLASHQETHNMIKNCVEFT